LTVGEEASYFLGNKRVQRHESYLWSQFRSPVFSRVFEGG
jgi:hypothetical protein